MLKKLCMRIVSLCLILTLFSSVSLSVLAQPAPRAVSGSTRGSGSDFYMYINSPSNSAFAHVEIYALSDGSDIMVSMRDPNGRWLTGVQTNRYQYIPSGYMFTRNINNAPAGKYTFHVISTKGTWANSSAELYDWYF